MLWTVNYGNGRGFATAMGAEWAVSEKVTIPVPPELLYPLGRMRRARKPSASTLRVEGLPLA